MGLFRCKKCFQSLVTERQETELFVMEWWNQALTELGISQWNIDPVGQTVCFGLTDVWDAAGACWERHAALMVEMGIAYTDFRCLMGSGAQVLAGLHTIWKSKSLFRSLSSSFFSRLLLRWIQSNCINTFCWALWSPVRCLGKRIGIYFSDSNYEVFEQIMKWTIE